MAKRISGNGKPVTGKNTQCGNFQRSHEQDGDFKEQKTGFSLNIETTLEEYSADSFETLIHHSHSTLQIQVSNFKHVLATRNDKRSLFLWTFCVYFVTAGLYWVHQLFEKQDQHDQTVLLSIQSQTREQRILSVLKVVLISSLNARARKEDPPRYIFGVSLPRSVLRF